MTRPLCVWCARPMPKHTISIHFGRDKDGPTNLGDPGYKDRPRNKGEAQRYSNLPVVSVSYWKHDGEDYVAVANYWDGTYGRSTANWSTKLCSGKCAKEMGLAAAENGMTSKAYAAKVRA
jgi:hypothetical protein